MECAELLYTHSQKSGAEEEIVFLVVGEENHGLSSDVRQHTVS